MRNYLGGSGFGGCGEASQVQTSHSDVEIAGNWVVRQRMRDVQMASVAGGQAGLPRARTSRQDGVAAVAVVALNHIIASHVIGRNRNTCAIGAAVPGF